MKLPHHLARFIPEDKGVMSLKEDEVLAALEALGLVTRLQQSWSPRDGVVPAVKRPKKLLGSTWGRGDELISYLQMTLEEGREHGQTWRERVPEIAARIPPAGHSMVLFALCACAYDPVRAAVEQELLIEAFAAAFGEDRAACAAEVVEHFRDHFDYEQALHGLQERAPAPAAAAGTPAELRAALIEELEQLGLTLPGTLEMADAELERLPEVTVLALFEDHAASARIYLLPGPIITPTRRTLGAARRLCLAEPDDVESDEVWFAAVRLVTALGDDLTQDYEAYLGGHADRPGCPGREELAASLGVWSQYLSVTFEDGSKAAGRASQGAGFNAHLTELMLLNLAG